MRIKVCVATLLMLAGTELFAMRGRRHDGESRGAREFRRTPLQAGKFRSGKLQEGSLRTFGGARPFTRGRFGLRGVEARDGQRGFAGRFQDRPFKGSVRPFARRRVELRRHLSPLRSLPRRFQSRQFAKFRTPQRFGQQRAFLTRSFRGHPWSWWWRRNPRLFFKVFPVYFNRVYGYYPPVYYDYYDTYGSYPIIETSVAQAPAPSFRECVRQCLNTTNLDVDECLGNCGGQE